MIWKSTWAGVFVMAALACSGSAGVAKCTDQHHLTHQQMFAFLTRGIDAAQAGKMVAADQAWRTAYQIVQAGCYEVPVWAQERVASIEQGNAQNALDGFGYDDLVSEYVDVGADKPYVAGVAAAKRGDFPTAARYFRTALQLSNKHLGQNSFPQADFALGVVVEAMGNRVDAVRQWRITLSDSWPAVPMASLYGPDRVWFAALELYATQRTPPFPKA